jgi:hypothetical protein
MGQEGRFPPPRLSARCRISQETFAGASGNDGVAPILLKKSRWKGLRVSRRHQTAVKAHLVRNPSIGSVLLAGSPRVPSSLACAL